MGVSTRILFGAIFESSTTIELGGLAIGICVPPKQGVFLPPQPTT